MKRKITALLLAVLLCLLLTGTVSAADGSGIKFVDPLWIIVCLVFGFLLALIPMAILKGQIRNVHSKTDAADYSRDGSFELQLKQDTFLRRVVTSTPIPKSKDNG